MAKDEANKKGPTVLMVEDDAFLVRACQVKFQQEGINVWVATSGKAALSFIEGEPPNAVILDLMLPAVSGFDVLSAMRKNEKWKNVPVIILTNLGQSQDIERGKNLGATDYIIKADVRLSDVVEAVKRVISKP